MKQGNNVVSLPNAVEMYDLNEDTLNVNAFNYRKKYGVNPKWYIKDEKNNIRIDIKELNKPNDLDQNVWLFNTDPEYGLYWILNYYLGYSDSKVAEYLARKSQLFTSPNAWRLFLSAELFNRSKVRKVNYKYTMQIDFFAIASRLIYNLKKQGKLNALLG